MSMAWGAMLSVMPTPLKSLPYPQPTSAAVTAVMKGNRRTDTRPEVRVRSLLHRAGLRFRKNLLIRTDELSVRPDIVFTRARVAVFIDGCFWHSCPDHGTTPRANTGYWGPKLERNLARDARVNAALCSAGWAVVRIWEHVNPTKAAARVAATVQSVMAE